MSPTQAFLICSLMPQRLAWPTQVVTGALTPDLAPCPAQPSQSLLAAASSELQLKAWVPLDSIPWALSVPHPHSICGLCLQLRDQRNAMEKP